MLPLGDTSLALELIRVRSESWLCLFLAVGSKTHGFALLSSAAFPLWKAGDRSPSFLYIECLAQRR